MTPNAETAADGWRRLLNETSDPKERAFYAALHEAEPSVRVEWAEAGPMFVGIGLKHDLPPHTDRAEP